VDVFSTMLSESALLSRQKGVPAFVSQVSSSLGFAGAQVVGVVNVHLSEQLARRSAVMLLGLPAGDVPGQAEIAVAVGELSNQLAGGLTSWLCGAGVDCVMSTPSIIRGKAFTVEQMPDMDQNILLFECGCEQVVVEMYLRLNRA